jgi:hypothetical protein
MKDQIEVFLDAGRAYFQAAQIARVELENLNATPKHRRPDTAGYLDAERRTARARNALVDAGRELARLMSERGNDALPLLTFVRSVDGLGYGCASGEPLAKLPLWTPLAASLELLAIGKGTPAAAATLGTGQSEGTDTKARRPKPDKAKTDRPKPAPPKSDKPITRTEKIRKQRLDFCRPRRAKDEPWVSIYAEYRKKYPQDEDADPATLRLTFERHEGKYAADVAE